MTIEQLLECSADQLEKMTEAELLQHFAPYLTVTRPELAEKPLKREDIKGAVNRMAQAAKKQPTEKQQKLAQAEAIFKQFGLTLK